MDRSKNLAMSPFIMFSSIIFFVILVVGGIAFIFAMQQIIRTNKANEMAHTLDTERVRLESSLNAEIAIALKLADSPVVKKYLMNPTDPELEMVAAEEIASYREAFTGHSIFWVNNQDMVFYSDDYEPYKVDADDPVNYWYNMTLYETEVYNFNINYNPDLDTIRLWINAPVFGDDGNPIGIVGTGIHLSEFVDAVYHNFDEGTELFFFIDDGRIYGARDIRLIIEGTNIADALHDIGIDILDEAKALDNSERKIFDIPNGIVAIGEVPMLDWYYVATTTYGFADYDTTMSALFIVVLVVILVIIIMFNVFVGWFVKSLRIASENLALVARKREQELIAENDMLDRLNRMKIEFFQNMSHDFKTPLTVISANVLDAMDMLDFEVEKNELREPLGDAQREVMRLGRMVDSAVKQASMYDNRQDMEPLYIAPLLRASAETHRVLLERHGNVLSIDIPQALPKVMANTDMILLVLSNLFSNANRYTRKGEIAIRATVADDNITVSVKDSGAGIKPELLPRVFERGVSDHGSGLGLSICKTSIESHGGTITIASEYGQGAEVSFTLPVWKA